MNKDFDILYPHTEQQGTTDPEPEYRELERQERIFRIAEEKAIQREEFNREVNKYDR